MEICQESPQPKIYEKLVFVLPDEPEEQIAAMAVIREYWSICKQEEGLEFDIHIQNINPKLRWLAEQMDHITIHNELLYVPNADLLFTFDTARARAIASTTDKHIVQAYGLMLGAEPTIFPKLPVKFDWGFETEDHLADILVLNNFKNVDKVLELVADHLPQYSSLMIHPGDFGRNTQLARGGKLFIGARSADTYLAAATFKPVIELYDTRYSKGWLSKWTNANYIMIHGDNIDIDLIWRAIERVHFV